MQIGLWHLRTHRTFAIRKYSSHLRIFRRKKNNTEMHLHPLEPYHELIDDELMNTNFFRTFFQQQQA